MRTFSDKPPSYIFIVWYCGALTMLASIANDMLLTAFVLIESDLSLEKGQAGLMMAFFFLGSGLGQFIFGPLADYIGRRKVILVCIGLFLIGAGLLTVAESLTALIFGRLLQGIGCSICQSITRAIQRDLYADRKLALAMSHAFTVFSLGPVLMPLLGAIMLDYATWRSLMWFHILSGALMFLWTFVALPETLARRRMMNFSRAKKQLRQYFACRTSGFYTLPACIGATGLITMLSLTPGFLMADFGFSPLDYAFAFSICVGGAILPGQALNRFFIRRYNILNSCLILAGLSLASQTIMWLSALVWGTRAEFLCLTMFTSSLFALAQSSNLASLCINPHPRIAGFASSVHGLCAQSLGAVLCLLIIYPIIDGRPVYWIGFTVMVAALMLGLIGIGRLAVPALEVDQAKATVR